MTYERFREASISIGGSTKLFAGVRNLFPGRFPEVAPAAQVPEGSNVAVVDLPAFT